MNLYIIYYYRTSPKVLYYILLLTLSFKTYNMVLIVITSKSKTIWQRLTLYKPLFDQFNLSWLKVSTSSVSRSISSLLFSSPLSQYLIDSSSLCSFISLSLCLHVHADRFYASSS